MSSFLSTSAFKKRVSPPASAAKEEEGVQFSAAPVDSSGEFDIGWGFASEFAEIIQGRNISLINSCVEICGGIIGGSGTKFCGRARLECEIKSHSKRRFADMVEGLYVKVGGDELLCSPVIPSSIITGDLAQSFLDRAFGSTDEIVQYFDFVLSREDTSKALVFGELDMRKQEANYAMSMKSPGKRRKVSELQIEFQELGSSLIEEEANLEQQATLKKAKLLIEFLLRPMGEEQETLRILLEKFNVLLLQVGAWPKQTREQQPPSLWSGIASLGSDLSVIEEDLLKIGGVRVGPGDLKIVEASIGIDLSSLRSDTHAAVSALEANIAEMKGVGSLGLTQHRSIAELSDDLSELKRTMVDTIARSETSLKAMKSSLDNGDKSGVYSVKYANYSFSSISEVGAWAETLFKGGPFPFGTFVDVYSILQRVTSYKDVASTTELKNMEMLKKLELSADAGLAIESFKHPLPKVFRGNSLEPATGRVWLPGIPTPERWEDMNGLIGARVSIKTSMEEIRSRLESLISERLRNNAEAQALARQMLSDTLTFITALCEFISETYRSLEIAGFTKADAWQLVSKLVHRIFATDCHMRRGVVSEVLDASDSRILGMGILWATLATHQVMRDYLKHGIENHPSMSSEHVRFLVANSGLSKMKNLEARMVRLEEENKQLKKDVLNADKAAKSAANKADEAKVLAKKK